MPNIGGRVLDVLFSSDGQYSQRRKTNLNINFISQALNYAIKKVAEQAGTGQLFSNRKSSLSGAIRLLIGAEDGSLAKELHRADIDVPPPRRFTAPRTNQPGDVLGRVPPFQYFLRG